MIRFYGRNPNGRKLHIATTSRESVKSNGYKLMPALCGALCFNDHNFKQDGDNDKVCAKCERIAKAQESKIEHNYIQEERSRV